MLVKLTVCVAISTNLTQPFPSAVVPLPAPRQNIYFFLFQSIDIHIELVKNKNSGKKLGKKLNEVFSRFSNGFNSGISKSF